MKFLVSLLFFLTACSQRMPDLVLTDREGNEYFLTDCRTTFDYTTCTVHKIKNEQTKLP